VSTKFPSRVLAMGLGLSLSISPAFGQNVLGLGSGGRDIAGGVFGEVYFVDTLTLSSAPNRNVKFKLDRVVSLTNEPVSFFILSPSSGTTTATIRVGPNPNVTRYMRPGGYIATVFFTTVDQSPPSTVAGLLRLTLRAPAPAAIGAVVNTASLQPVASPGGILSVYGESLGPPVFAAEYNGEGLYPTTFGNTTVTFNGVAAPLLHMSPSRIDAVAPYALAGQKTAQVVVSRYGQSSPAFEVPVADASPAIFAGPGDILNYQSGNYSPNSADNPAAPGSVIVLFATGAGVFDDTVPETSISLIASPFRARPVSLTIGGLPATILYAGAAPYQTIGKLQVNVIVPQGVASGPQPLVLAIGGTGNEQQQVTVAIK